MTAAVVALALQACADFGASLGAGEMVSVELPSVSADIDELDAALVTVIGGDGETAELAVRVAGDADSRRRGLMGVRQLPEDTGMLFTWDGGEREGGFWMRDTLIPLDIAFVGTDQQIEAVLTMAPCTSDPCPTYDPGIPYVAAVEVPAGWFDANGVEVGDELTWVRANEG